MSDQLLCGYCMLPVAKGLPGIKHMGTSVAHPHVSMCLEATREAARAWQEFRDWCDKPKLVLTAWARFDFPHEKPVRIRLCDSDAPGAFPLYRRMKVTP